MYDSKEIRQSLRTEVKTLSKSARLPKVQHGCKRIKLPAGMTGDSSLQAIVKDEPLPFNVKRVWRF